MWLSNFSDGSSISSKNCFWTQLREQMNGKRMTGLQLSHPHFQNLYLNLSNLDKYYFVTEAVMLLGGGEDCVPVGAQLVQGTIPMPKPISNSVMAEIIGGHDLILGIGLEVRLDYKGSVKSRVYKLDSYKYSAEILVEGHRREE